MDDLVELREDVRLEELGVDLRHAVDLVRTNDGQVRHADLHGLGLLVGHEGWCALRVGSS